MALKTSEETLSQILIFKGEVDKVVLNKNDLNYEWIENQLKLNNIDNIEKIYLGVLTAKKDLYIIR